MRNVLLTSPIVRFAGLKARPGCPGKSDFSFALNTASSFFLKQKSRNGIWLYSEEKTFVNSRRQFCVGPSFED